MVEGKRAIENIEGEGRSIGLDEPLSGVVRQTRDNVWQSRLGANPLIVLLPECGDLRLLIKQRGVIERWLQEEESSEQSDAASVAMLQQVLFWIPEGQDEELAGDADGATIISAVYELGRVYFEHGFTSAAARIFEGLSIFEPSFTPGLIGFGVTRLERGQFNESLSAFRDAIQQGRYVLEAKLALCGAFIALGEFRRAASILQELAKASASPEVDPDITRLWQAFTERCSVYER